MQIHELQSKTKRKKAILVGRGGKRGKTSGKGTKGQRARAGRKIRPELRDTIKRLPKLRGRGKSSFKSFAERPLSINLSSLSVFKDGEKVTPVNLMVKGVIESYKGRVPAVKILGTGEITAKLTFSNLTISASAAEKIKNAGGTIK